ncbi:MAG: hypothetical protein HS132_03830 [Planctomycetia bacterium]|nr:hypothetical protein [Planctomycetia bacterium]
MKNASNPQTFCDPDEHRGVFDIDYLPGWRLGNVQWKPKDVSVGLADINEAGVNKKIHETIKLEVLRRPFPGMMIPPVSEQDTTDIQIQRRDQDSSFHLKMKPVV